MIRFTKKLGWVVAVAAIATGAVGCVGGVAPSGGTSSDLLISEHPLTTLDRESWSMAPGCEGHLGGEIEFAIASAEDGLVAAVDAEGSVVCVDTVEDVEEELDETGRSDEADELVTAFAESMAGMESATGARFETPNREGDPDPEPNIGENRFRFAGDPDPEPNMGS